MGKSNYVMLYVSIVVLIVIVSFGVTYSYFSANYVNGTSTSNIDLTSGKMIINFTDKNPNIVFSNVIPGPTSSVNDAVLSDEEIRQLGDLLKKIADYWHQLNNEKL